MTSSRKHSIDGLTAGSSIAIPGAASDPKSPAFGLNPQLRIQQNQLLLFSSPFGRREVITVNGGQMTVFYAGIGSRETPEDVLKLMTKIAEKKQSYGHILRSGAADGADAAFEAGAGRLKEIWLPWIGFNGHDSLLVPTPQAFELAAKYHPAWNKCRLGARKLHARNCHQVLGKDLKTPVQIVIGWTRDAAGGGGTGQAIRIARAYDIPVHDLGDPFTRKQHEEEL